MRRSNFSSRLRTSIFMLGAAASVIQGCGPMEGEGEGDWELGVDESALNVNAAEDTWVDQSAPSTNRGSDTRLRIEGGAGASKRTYLKFAVTSIPKGAAVTSAEVVLSCFNGTDNGPGIRTASHFTSRSGTGETSTAWREGNTVWSTRPIEKATSDFANVGAVKASTSAPATVRFNVTKAVTANGTYAFQLAQFSVDALECYSSEYSNAARRPLLRLITATPPQPPSPTATGGACTDGVKNGTETGLDCGGECGKCHWPFAAVPRQTLRSSPKKVFAHWHYYPVAINNRDPRTDYYTANWVAPTGEGGKHASYGGYMRERPLPRLPRPEADWLLRDAKQDIRLAADIGIDGFFLNMWTDSDTGNGGLWTRAKTSVAAASSVGNFDIIPNFDMDLVGGTDSDALSRMMRMLGALKTESSLYRMPDGRWVIGAFLADRRSPTFYSTLKSRASAELGMKLYVIPVFLGTGNSTLFSNFASVSDAYAGWGTAIPTSAGASKRLKDLAATHGKPWIQPISSQDFRPYNFKYWEAENTRTLRSHWETAIADGINSVQIVTWNDQHEHHAIRPSTGKQWSTYDLTAYYIQWFKTGTKPPLRRDALYYSHRIQRSTAPYDTSKQANTFRCVTNCPAVDQVELVAFLTAPGTIEITAGGSTVRKNVEAGMSVLTAPLAAGRPTFRLLRAGATSISLQSPFEVKASMTYQDFLYRGGSSLRQALSSSSNCAQYCEAADAARCELCPAEPMWLRR